MNMNERARPPPRLTKPGLPQFRHAAGFQTYTNNFLNLLVEKDRMHLIYDICESFEAQYCELTDTQVNGEAAPARRCAADAPSLLRVQPHFNRASQEVSWRHLHIALAQGMRPHLQHEQWLA